MGPPGPQQHGYHLQSDHQAPASPLPSAAAGGGHHGKSWGGWPEGGVTQANRERRNRPGRLGQAAGDCCPQIQVRIRTTLLCKDSPPPPALKVHTTDPAPSHEHNRPGFPPGGALSDDPCCVDSDSPSPSCRTSHRSSRYPPPRFWEQFALSGTARKRQSGCEPRFHWMLKPSLVFLLPSSRASRLFQERELGPGTGSHLPCG